MGGSESERDRQVEVRVRLFLESCISLFLANEIIQKHRNLLRFSVKFTTNMGRILQ